MKSTLIFTLSLLFAAVCVVSGETTHIAPQIPVSEILPSPLTITRDSKNPDKYDVTFSWYGSGYKPDGRLKYCFFIF